MDFLVLSDIHQNWNHLEKMISMARDFDGVIFLGDLIKHGSEGEEVSTAIENLSKIHDASKFTFGVPGNGAIPVVVKHLENLGISVHGTSHTFDDLGFFGVGGTPDPVNLILELRSFFKSNIQPAIELHPKALDTLAVFGVTIRNDKFIVEDWTEEQERELEQYRGPFDHTEVEIYDTLCQGFQTLSDCSFRVLLSHIPPYQPLLNPIFPDGVSTGSKGITKFIEEFKPSVVLSGHYHISHEFDIASIPCFIVPAVVDGFYSILSIDQKKKKFQINAKLF